MEKSSRKRPLRIGDIYAARTFRDDFGFNSENREAITVNSDEVPEKLKPLIEDVQRWAISCDVTRADYFQHQPQDEIDAFWQRVNPYVSMINSWLDTLDEDVRLWPSAAVQFLDLLMAHQSAWRPTAEERLALDVREAARAHQIELDLAINRGSDAFSQQKYRQVIELLEPFESEIGKVMLAKLAYSRRKVSKSGIDSSQVGSTSPNVTDN